MDHGQQPGKRMKRAAIIVAAGKGLRIGGPVPKQYQRLGGEAVLTRTLRQVLAARIDTVLVAIHPDYRPDYDRAVAPIADQIWGITSTGLA